jgi:hypothetical protein
VVIRYLYIVGIAIPPHEAHAELVIDGNAVLAFLSWCSSSSLLPGGIRKSSTLAAELSMASFFLDAFRRFAGGILLLFPVSQNSFVLLSAKDLITDRV